MTDDSHIERYRKRLNKATSYSEVWEIVRDTVEFALHKRRAGMLLFLDDLPIQLGAYHPLGTNNIVLNRKLVQIAEEEDEPKNAVNALIYNLLIHEYLHALGEVSEVAVRETVIKVAEECFGKDCIVAHAAMKSPWVLLKRIPLQAFRRSRVEGMKIVKDFEKTQSYIV